MKSNAAATSQPDGSPAATASEQRDATRGANRLLALGLIAVTLIILGGAFAVGLLAQHGLF